jgi:hypothetical protein
MRRLHQIALLSAIAVSLSAAVSAQEGDTLITDPTLLTRLGFPPDARNVYLAKGAVLDQESSPAEPEEFGTTDFGWTTVLGNQHNNLGTSTVYSTQSGGTGSVYHISGGNVYDAQLHLPSGGLLRQATFFIRDDGSDGFLQGSIVRVCQTGFPIIGPPMITVLGSANSDDGDTVFSVVVSPGVVINNLSCAYVVRTVFSQISPATPTNFELRKIRAGWQRQVSAAPLTATFPNDTPTTHPYFRFIEALAAAGITGGCAPGSYCPNNPITRGEMAVFLSVALGLHFPN